MVIKGKSPSKKTPNKIGKKILQKALPPPKPVEESESEDSDDSEEEEQVVAQVNGKANGHMNGKTPNGKANGHVNGKTPNGTVNGNAESSSDDDSEDDSESDDDAVKEAEKPAAAAVGDDSDESDDDDEDDSDDDDSEDEAPAKAEKKMDTEEDDSDSSEEEEMDMDSAAKKAQKRKLESAAKEEESSEDEDDDEESSDDDEDEATTLKVTGFEKEKKLQKFLKKNQLTVDNVAKEGTAFIIDCGSSEMATKVRECLSSADGDYKVEDVQSSKETEVPTTFKMIGFAKEKKLLKFLKSNEILYTSVRQDGDAFVVELENAEQAPKLLSAYDNETVTVEVVKAATASSKKNKSEEPPAKKAKTTEVERDEDATLFVVGFGEGSEDKLRSLFPTAVDISIPEKDGKPKGFAFIQFESETEVLNWKPYVEGEKKMALDGVNLDFDFKGKKSTMEAKKQKKKENQEGRTMYVKGLSYELDEDSLRDVFPNAKEIRIPVKPDGSPKGFGFVEFETEEEVKTAIDEKNNTEIAGRFIELDFMGSKSKVHTPKDPGSSLFVRNLADETDEAKLREIFTTAVGCKVLVHNDTGRSKGFGFVDFATAEAAEVAMSSFQGLDVNGWPLDIKVSDRGGKGGGGGDRGGFGGRGRGGGGRGRGGDRGGSRGRGRGGRGGGGGGGGCFKCGEEGHFSRECPQGGGGGGGGGACFKCGEEGHFSRECPQGGGGGGGGGACFKCGEEGHFSRECPQGGGGSRACYKCGEEGHISRDCPQGGGNRGCFNCGEEGHISRECPKGGGGGRGGGRGRGGRGGGRGRGGSRGGFRGGRGGGSFSSDSKPNNKKMTFDD